MAILAGTGYSKESNSLKAGQEAAKMVWEYVKEPDLIILFASIFHNHEMVLNGVRSIIKDTSLIGGSAFGEMTNYGMNNNSVVLMAIKADKIKFSLGLGDDSDKDPVKAGEEAAREALKGLGKKEVQTGIFISEMLGSDKTLKGLQDVLGKEVSLFGGCCSGNRKVPVGDPEFTKGYQYLNERICRHSIPLLLLSGDFKCSFGVGHGWRPLGKIVKMGRTKENKIYEIDNISAFDFYKQYLGESSFVPYPLGFYQNDRQVFRAVTSITEKGVLGFTTEIAPGTEVRIARGSRAGVYKSSEEAAKQALDRLEGAKPRLAIIASCISRHTMLGTRVYKELEVIQGVLGKELPLIGFYCAGEYAPVSGRNLYHNFAFCIYLLGEKIGEEPEKIKIEVSERPKIEKDKILIITKKEKLVSGCKTALTGLEFDFEWIKDNLDLEDSLEKNIPNIVILEIENEPLIQRIKKADQDIQIILLIEKEKEASLKEIIQKLGESICGFCFIPFRMFELPFLVKKALKMNKMYIKNGIVDTQLIETKEDLNAAEESIEVSERVLMQSYREIEMAKNNLDEQVKERTKELEEARDYTDNIIKSMIDTLIVVDPDAKIRTINPAMVDLLGYKEDELIGKEVATIFAEEEEEEEEEVIPFKGTKMKKLIEEGSIRDYDMTYKTKAGEKIPVSFSGSVMKDKEGELVGIVGVARDMREIKRLMQKEKELAAAAAAAETEKKRAAELETAKAYTDNIIKSMIDTLVVVNPDATIRTINPATVELLDYKEDELIGKPVATIFAEEEEEEVSIFKGTRLKKLIEEGTVRNYDMKYRTRKGEIIPVSFSGSVMRDKTGELVGIVGIARDLREFKKLQAQLVQAGKMAAMGTLGAGIAHQLNQPLAGIRGFAQTVLMQIDKKNLFYEDLKKIEEQTGYMSEIITNISGFARAAEFKKEPIDINEPIEKALQLFTEQIRLHGIKLVKNLDPKLPKVNADTNQMQQVFVNFITNAREALDDLPKETKKELAVSSQKIVDSSQKKEFVEVTFKDTGSGIPVEIKDRIFEPFFTTKGPRSTGLGLSLNYGMIQDHGGVIEFETKVGKGTTFVVKLPAIN